MRFSATCAAGLMTALAATAQQPARDVPAGAAHSSERGAAVARWDGHVVSPDEAPKGLDERARDSIETWRTFAERRGYRIDLDPSQRVLLVSDAERFEAFSTSAAIVERVLDEMKPWMSPSETPIVVLRASSESDAETARNACRALGIDGQLGVFVETGGLRDRRAVDARLAEAIARATLEIDAPFLSEWMADGLASQIAEETTGRAMIDGKAETLRSVQTDVSRRQRAADDRDVDLLAISGALADSGFEPMQAEAMAIVACLAQHYGDTLPQLVHELGHRQPAARTAKYVQEGEALQKFIGMAALQELQRALVDGRRFRPE